MHQRFSCQCAQPCKPCTVAKQWHVHQQRRLDQCAVLTLCVCHLHSQVLLQLVGRFLPNRLGVEDSLFLNFVVGFAIQICFDTNLLLFQHVQTIFVSKSQLLFSLKLLDYIFKRCCCSHPENLFVVLLIVTNIGIKSLQCFVVATTLIQSS